MDRKIVSRELVRIAQLLIAESEYQKVFRENLDETGADELTDLNKEEKKKLFKEVSKDWKGK